MVGSRGHELLAGEMVSDEVRCAMCGHVGSSTQVADPASMGARVMPAFERYRRVDPRARGSAVAVVLYAMRADARPARGLERSRRMTTTTDLSMRIMRASARASLIVWAITRWTAPVGAFDSTTYMLSYRRCVEKVAGFATLRPALKT